MDSSNNYLRRSDLYLETVSVIAFIFSFEQVFNSELIWRQVIHSEKLKSAIVGLENEVVGGHDSLNGIESILADKIDLLLCLMIPHPQFILVEPEQVVWVIYTGEAGDHLSWVVVADQLILGCLQ